MAKVKVELNRKGVGELLKSRETQQMLQHVASERSQGWATDTKAMETRVIASIYSDDPDQIRDELDAHRIVGGL